MANKYYVDIFKHSGTSYHQAMQRFPTARTEEFQSALALLELKNGESLLDVPAGGGYLRHYLSDSIDYKGYDFIGSFSEISENGDDDSDQIGLCTETGIPLASHSIDNALCLASMHHVKDKAGFLTEVRRCLKARGTIVIGDVIAGSKEAVFLNGFVNAWNSLGHHGTFLEIEQDMAMLIETGFEASFSVQRYRWNFADQLSCHTFLRQLFNLDKTPSDDRLASVLDKLGTSTSGAGFHLNWSLGFLIAVKI